MKKIFSIIGLAALLVGCAPSTKTGCEPKKMRREIKFKGFAGALEPKNLQVRVIEVLDKKAGKIRLKCLTKQSDTVFVNFGWRGWNTVIKTGTKLTIHAYQSDSARVWYCRKISVNR